jgi:hypothetical protein
MAVELVVFKELVPPAIAMCVGELVAFLVVLGAALVAFWDAAELVAEAKAGKAGMVT